jgi:hypothetical protein
MEPSRLLLLPVLRTQSLGPVRRPLICLHLRPITSLSGNAGIVSILQSSFQRHASSQSSPPRQPLNQQSPYPQIRREDRTPNQKAPDLISVSTERVREIFGSPTLSASEGNRILNAVYKAQQQQGQQRPRTSIVRPLPVQGALERKAAEWLRVQADALKELEELERELEIAERELQIQGRREKPGLQQIKEYYVEKREKEEAERAARGEKEPVTYSQSLAMEAAKIRSGEIGKLEVRSNETRMKG